MSKPARYTLGLLPSFMNVLFLSLPFSSNDVLQVEDPSGLVNDEGLLSLVGLLKSSERLVQQSCIALRNLASQSAMQVLS